MQGFKLNSLNTLLSGKSMPWGYLGLCRLLSLRVKTPLDHCYQHKFNKEGGKAEEKGRNTQYPAPSLPLTSSTWPWLLSLWPGLPTPSPHGLTPRPPPHPPAMLLAGGGQVCTTPSTVWGQESAWCGSRWGSQGLSWVSWLFPCPVSSQGSCRHTCSVRDCVSHASCEGLGWYTLLPPGLEGPHGPAGRQFQFLACPGIRKC